MALDIVQRFKELPTECERIGALEALAKHMTTSECRIMVSMISNRLDPLFVLPTELVLQVFVHLQMLDVWRLRLVNRQWNTTLRSELLTETALAQWETHDSSDCGRSAESRANDTQETRIRNMQAVRLGRPFTFTDIADNVALRNCGINGALPPTYDLNGDMIAYICGVPTSEERQVMVRRLTDSSVWTFSGDARENIACIALTERVIAFTTYAAMLYVAPLEHGSGSSQRHVRLPSARVVAVAGDGGCIVTMLYDSGVRSSHMAIYDYDSGSYKDFEFAAQSVGRIEADRANTPDDSAGMRLVPGALLVNNKQRTIDVFSTVTSGYNTLEEPLDWPTRVAYIGHMRFTFSGIQTSASNLSFELHKIGPLLEYHAIFDAPRIHLNRVHPTGRTGLYNVCTIMGDSARPSARKSTRDRHIFTINFDSASCSLAASKIPHDGRFGGRSKGHVLYGSRWKSVCHAQDTSHKGLYVSRAQEEGLVAIQRLHDPSQRDPAPLRPFSWCDELHENRDIVLMCNESFLVAFAGPPDPGGSEALSGRIRAWCFDESIGMPGAQDTGLWKSSEEKPGHVMQGTAEKPRWVALPYQEHEPAPTSTTSDSGYWQTVLSG